MKVHYSYATGIMFVDCKFLTDYKLPGSVERLYYTAFDTGTVRYLLLAYRANCCTLSISTYICVHTDIYINVKLSSSLHVHS
jgi:hypothetical protein